MYSGECKMKVEYYRFHTLKVKLAFMPIDVSLGLKGIKRIHMFH